jgi:hypothetical protein
MKILYDDVIFRLQKVGGISNVFSQLMKFGNRDESIEFGYISTSKSRINNLYWSNLGIPKFVVKKNIPVFILQFIPFINLNDNIASLYHATYYNIPLKKNKLIYVITIHDLGYERGLMQLGLRRLVNIFFKRLASLLRPNCIKPLS